MSVSFWDRYAATGYDAIRVLLPYEALQNSVLTTFALQPGERVFVAGCGTGNLEERALKQVPGIQVDALDYSVEMLERARTKCADFPNARHHHGNLCTQVPFPDGSFDAAVMCNVLYALPDQLAALKEVKRVLRPGGRFVLCDRLPSSEVSPIWKAHFAAMRKLSLKRRVGQLVKTLAATPTLMGVAMLNANIQRRHQQGDYYFYAVEEISRVLAEMDYTVETTEIVYAEQCWLLRATLNENN